MGPGNFKFSGKGRISFAEPKAMAPADATYANAPAKLFDFGSYAVQLDNSYLIGSHECLAGTLVTFELSGLGEMCLGYFQNQKPKLAGLYINACQTCHGLPNDQRGRHISQQINANWILNAKKSQYNVKFRT